jgi:polar amino acid transport system ATP-binding protein/sulfate transport system ATP-binding protein
MENKHVPLRYKANSREIRLELLAGIIDSDGSPKHGCYDFISKFLQLAVDVCYVARSLGFAAYMKPCEKTCQTGNGGTYYRVCISGDLSVVPVRIKRKKLAPRQQIKNVLRTGILVRPAGYGEYFGFELDGDGLFLLGDFTVTHNTQLFRIMSGLNKPSSGRAAINGFDRPVKAGEVGVVMQSYPLLPHRTIMGNLKKAVYGKNSKTTEKEAAVMIQEMLHTFGVEDKANDYPAQLSGGQRQRVAIIQQVLCSDHFLLMDEPFSGLDIIMEDIVLQLIMKVANLNDLNTVIVITHDVSAAASICDHIVMLGHDRDAQGNIIPGAYFKKVYDLIERGLCWDQWHSQAAIRPALAEFIRELKEEFYKL